MADNQINGIRVLDSGHRYELGSLDGDHHQVLQFVKRCDKENPWRYPKNTNAHPGATLQMVIRALIDRLGYLQSQIWCVENRIIVSLLKLSLWLLEFRAARRHQRAYWHGTKFASESPICRICGHTVCDHVSVDPSTQSTVATLSGPSRAESRRCERKCLTAPSHFGRLRVNATAIASTT